MCFSIQTMLISMLCKMFRQHECQFKILCLGKSQNHGNQLLFETQLMKSVHKILYVSLTRGSLIHGQEQRRGCRNDEWFACQMVIDKCLSSQVSFLLIFTSGNEYINCFLNLCSLKFVFCSISSQAFFQLYGHKFQNDIHLVAGVHNRQNNLHASSFCVHKGMYRTKQVSW